MIGFIERSYIKETFGVTDAQIDAVLAELPDSERVIGAIKAILPSIMRLAPVVLDIIHTVNAHQKETS